MYKTIAIIGGFVVLGWILTMVFLSILSRRPTNLGVREGKLAACPSSDNCVCSMGGDGKPHVEPLTFTDTPEEAWQRLEEVLAQQPRTQVVTHEEGYVHAECRSFLFRFVDDLEFLLKPQDKQIEVRSASRAGRSDLGVNRARVEAIRTAFTRKGDL